jgi:UDP-glucose 6-dehydrogenase
MREAPSRVLARELVSRGASLRVHDPVAMEEARRVLEPIWPIFRAPWRACSSAMRRWTCSDADALVIVTEWKVFRSPDFSQIRACSKRRSSSTAAISTNPMPWPSRHRISRDRALDRRADPFNPRIHR